MRASSLLLSRKKRSGGKKRQVNKSQGRRRGTSARKPRARPYTTRIIGVISGKGGVGKTTTAANVGLLMVTEFGKRVLLIDGNLTNSNLGLYLGYLCPPVTLNDILKRLLPPEKAVYVHKSGLHIIPASLGIDSRVTYIMFKKAVIKLARSGDYDFIIVDAAAGVGPEVKASLNVCDEVLVVTVPELPTVTSAVRVAELARAMKKKVIGVISNRVRRKAYEVSSEEIEANCRAPLLGIVPDDDSIPESVSLREPLVLYAPGAASSSEFRSITRQLVEMSEPEPAENDGAELPAAEAEVPFNRLSPLQMVERETRGSKGSASSASSASTVSTIDTSPTTTSVYKEREVERAQARERDLTEQETKALLPEADVGGQTPGMKVMDWIIKRFGIQPPASSPSLAGGLQSEGSESESSSGRSSSKSQKRKRRRKESLR